MNRNWSKKGNVKKDINIMDEQSIAENPATEEGDTDLPMDQDCGEEEEDIPPEEEEDIPPEEEEEDEQPAHYDPKQGTSDQANWSHEPDVIPDDEVSVPHDHEAEEDKNDSEQDTDNKRYRLRPRTVKKRYVYSIQTLTSPEYWYDDRKDTINDFREKTVNRQEHSQYAVYATNTIKTPVIDQETEFLECSDMSAFYARKRAWRRHFSVCEVRSCRECELWARVHKVNWTPNQREYSQCLIDVEKINVKKNKTTKVKFSDKPVKMKLVSKYLPLDVYTLSLATKFCTSLKEVRSMSQYMP